MRLSSAMAHEHIGLRGRRPGQCWGRYWPRARLPNQETARLLDSGEAEITSVRPSRFLAWPPPPLAQGTRHPPPPCTPTALPAETLSPTHTKAQSILVFLLLSLAYFSPASFLFSSLSPASSASASSASPPRFVSIQLDNYRSTPSTRSIFCSSAPPFSLCCAFEKSGPD